MKQLVQKSKNLIEISYVQGVRSDKTNQREINAGLVEIIYQSKQWNHCCHGRTLRRQKFTIIRCFGKFRKLSLCEKCPNTEFFLVRIWTEYEKIRTWTRENSVFGSFHTVFVVLRCSELPHGITVQKFESWNMAVSHFWCLRCKVRWATNATFLCRS